MCWDQRGLDNKKGLDKNAINGIYWAERGGDCVGVEGCVVLTPPERRFVEIAVEAGKLTRDEVETIVEFHDRKRAEGDVVTLWDSAVITNVLDSGSAERLRSEAGNLDVEKLDEFTLVRHLGQGGMGSVWLAASPEHEKVALKVLFPSLAVQRPLVTRFLREAQVSIRLQHDRIIRGIAAGEAAGHYYFAMEFVDGGSVQALLDEQGALPPQRATEMILQVAEALAYAHENGIVHRDLKPDNMMLTSDGDVKLADLGLARLMEEGLTQLTGTGTAMGTPYYMAPEQCRDAKRADARSDMYSLGASWYHMIVGQPPFTGSSSLELMRKHERDPLRWPAMVRRQAPRGVVLTVERMMAKKPEARIQTMRQLVQIINEQCLGERDIRKELHLEETPDVKPLWEIRMEKDDGVKKFALPDERIRDLIRRGKLPPDLQVRRGGKGEVYRAMRNVPTLAALIPRMLLHTQAKKDQANAGKGTARAKADEAGKKPKDKKDKKKRTTLHEFVTHFEDYERDYERKKQRKKLKKVIVALAILVPVVVALILVYKHFQPQIMELVDSIRGAE